MSAATMVTDTHLELEVDASTYGPERKAGPGGLLPVHAHHVIIGQVYLPSPA